jgi:hypothetical protein
MLCSAKIISWFAWGSKMLKDITPALNKLQLACMDRGAPLSDIGKARRELFTAIRETVLQGMNFHISQDAERTKFLAQLEKINGD